MAWIDFVALRFAFNEWIADHSIRTRANRTVIHSFACGTIAAHIRTRINALIVHTSLCSLTIRANDAFGVAASASWCSIIAGNAFADGRIG